MRGRFRWRRGRAKDALALGVSCAQFVDVVSACAGRVEEAGEDGVEEGTEGGDACYDLSTVRLGLDR